MYQDPSRPRQPPSRAQIEVDELHQTVTLIGRMQNALRRELRDQSDEVARTGHRHKLRRKPDPTEESPEFGERLQYGFELLDSEEENR